MNSFNGVSVSLINVLRIKTKKGISQIKPRPFFSLSLRLSGNCEFEINKKKYIAKGGDIIAVPSETAYSGNRLEEDEIIVFHFHALSPLFIAPVCYKKVDEKIKQLFIEAHNVFEKKEQGFYYKTTSILYEIFYRLNFANEILKDTIDIIKNEIDCNFAKSTLKISALAKNHNISPSLLRLRFNERYNISPQQYLINTRIEYAKQLLDTNEFLVKEVCFRSGLKDLKYFSTYFKKKTGISPSKYKND